MAGWFVSQQILTLADRFLLAALVGVSSVGIYSASYDLFNRSLYLVADGVTLALRPLVMQAVDAGDPSRVRDYLQRGIRFFLLPTVPVLVTAVLWRRPVIELLLPPDYWAGARIVPLIMFGFLAWHMSTFLQQVLEARRRTGRIFVAAAIAAGANVVLNLLLIPRFGYTAAAVATLTSYVLLLVGIVVYCGREARMVVPWKSVVRLLVAGAAMAGVFSLAPLDPPARAHLPRLMAFGAAAWLVFAAVLAGLGEFPRAELRQLRFMVQKL